MRSHRQSLRNLCELVVAQDMFTGVVRRYEPNVRMTTLDTIKIDQRQTSIATIVPAFDTCCRSIASHSQTIETQGIRPTLHELKADYKVVSDAREAHKGESSGAGGVNPKRFDVTQE